MIVAVTDCEMLFEEPGGGTRRVTVPAGTECARKAGVEHNVGNAGPAAMTLAMTFVEVELL